MKDQKIIKIRFSLDKSLLEISKDCVQERSLKCFDCIMHTKISPGEVLSTKPEQKDDTPFKLCQPNINLLLFSFKTKQVTASFAFD